MFQNKIVQISYREASGQASSSPEYMHSRNQDSKLEAAKDLAEQRVEGRVEFLKMLGSNYQFKIKE